MKPFFLLTLAVAPLAGLAQTLTNDGSTITVQAGAALYVAGAVQNNASGTFTNAGTVQLTGDLTNAGTLTSAGTLLFSGTSNQTFAPGPAPAVATLVVDKGGTGGQNVLSIPADLTIGTSLSLLNGLVRTAPAATITLPDGASVTGEASRRYVQGNLRVVRAAVSGSTPVDFTNSARLNPNGLNLGTVTITRTAGLQTAGLSYGQNLAGTNKGIDRVWTVAATGAQPTAATPATIALSWTDDDDNGPAFATGQLWRAASAAGPWARQGAPASAAGRSFAVDVTQLGALTVSSLSAPLPVELSRFTAEPVGEDALLQWATASEKNNDRFEVEASADGRAFRRIGQVAGAGSSTQAHEYQFLDPAIARYAANPVYYRLRQVDADGTARYSPVRTVAVRGQAELALFPNPTARAATLTGALPGTTVTVYDALGRQVLAATADAAGTAALELPRGRATGVYVVRVGRQTLRLLVE